MMSAPCKTLSTRDRWLVYFVMAALPGLNISVWFGFAWSMVFELVMWIPQQRLFDALGLAETLPYHKSSGPPACSA
jgi:hypothetical protein